ncbi:hypothetical protein L7F22_036209 [Adiantum nelumboides]|nr:hypothetical protein [Adiantum nelumboides]
MASSQDNSLYNIKKLDGTNFPLWKKQIWHVLVQKKQLKPIKLKGIKPEDMDEDEWNEMDELALSTIMLALAESVYFNVADEVSAYDAWTKLSGLYEKQSAASQVYWLKKLVALKMKEWTPMSNHLNEFNTIYSQLSAQGVRFDEPVRAMFLLITLPKSWDTFRTALSNSAPPDGLTIADVEGSLLTEETIWGSKRRHLCYIVIAKVLYSWLAHFVPVKKTAKPDHLARLFVAQIFRLHGMPETIVSDRDPRFTSLFFKAIWANIGTRLQFSSSFHPQTDGQSEIANSVVLDLLKSYISDQKTQWERCLPLVEFAYNNTIHSSTGKAPFEIVEGVRKVPPFLSTKDKILEANEYTRDLDTVFAKVRETLQKSQERQKKAANRHRRDSKLKENDWVLLRFDKARLRQKKGKEELSMRYYGPFQITEQIKDISFRLRLPDTWKIHNVFHVNLWKTFGDVPDDGEPEEQPEVEANEEILVPEQVLAHKVTKKGKARRRFLIEFKNFPAFDAKWMEEEDLADTPQILKLYIYTFI